MSRFTDDVSIHAKKFYRVILQGVDPEKETQESFAIKLSMRTRTPLSRVRHALNNLPYTLKNGLSISQANRLNTVLQEIGGVSRVDSYLVTPGEKPRSSGLQKTGPLQVREEERSPTEKTMVCQSCGWEEDETAQHCSLCHSVFEESKQEEEFPPPPEENPLDVDEEPEETSLSQQSAGFLELIMKQIHVILIAVILVLLVLLFLK